MGQKNIQLQELFQNQTERWSCEKHNENVRELNDNMFARQTKFTVENDKT